MLTIRFDRAGRGLGATPIRVTPEGYKVYRGVAAFGDVVLEYPEDGVNELAPTADVMGPEVLKDFVGVPFSIHHPDDMLSADDPETLQSAAVGAVLAARPNLKATPPELEVEVVVWTRPAQEDIESGRVAELSPGYSRDPEKAPRGASLGGKPYQVIQRRRRYNHLSGVISARGVTPDGRRARLDEAAECSWRPVTMPAFTSGPTYTTGPLVGRPANESLAESLLALGSNPELAAEAVGAFVEALGRADARAAYAPLSMDDLITADPVPTNNTKRADAEPEAEGGQPEVEAEEVVVAGGESPLEGFSPDDAEVLKMLSPEGLARLMMALQQVKAEAAEQAVMAAPPGAAVEVEAEEADASAAAREKEAIGEVEEAAAKKAEAEVGKDATAPMASQGLTAQDMKAVVDEAVKQGIAALYDRMKADMKPAPAAAPAKQDAVKPAAKVDAAALTATITERRRLDAAFVGLAKRDGHLTDAEPATVKSAATKMLAVIAAELPDLVGMAKEALKDPTRMDSDFLKIYQAAEGKRRDGLIDDQQSAFVGFGGAGYDAQTLSLIDELIK